MTFLIGCLVIFGGLYGCLLFVSHTVADVIRFVRRWQAAARASAARRALEADHAHVEPYVSEWDR